MKHQPHALPEDSRIIELYNRRDESAITATDRKYGAYCMAVSMNILDSYPDAEECVNDTYLHTCRSISLPNLPSLQMFKSIPFLLGILWMIVAPLLRDCLFGGASLGKLICGLKVKDTATDGKPSFGKLILRGLFFYLIAVEFILIPANRGRSIADIASGTAVVRRKEN